MMITNLLPYRGELYDICLCINRLIFFIYQKSVRLIMDFIPNHTGRGSPWFEKSQKKEGKYKDYYIWAPCDTKKNTYPNNWVSITVNSSRISVL